VTGRGVPEMVWVEDKGATFDAPIDVVWKYIFGGGDHDAAHHTTRAGKMKLAFKEPIILLYTAERKYGTTWKKETMRISFFPPVASVQELLDGPLKGSKWTYVYTPHGRRTRVDAYGEFRSRSLPTKKLKRWAVEFLANEFREDAPGVRAMGRAHRP